MIVICDDLLDSIYPGASYRRFGMLNNMNIHVVECCGISDVARAVRRSVTVGLVVSAVSRLHQT